MHKKMHLLFKRHLPQNPEPEARYIPLASPQPFISDALAVHHPTPNSLCSLNLPPPPPPLLSPTSENTPPKPRISSSTNPTAQATTRATFSRRSTNPRRRSEWATSPSPLRDTCKRMQCAQCNHRRWPEEYPVAPPTSTCTHGVCRCVYCLHESIRIAVARAGKTWREGGVVCPENGCGEVLGVQDVQRGVLLWRRRRRGGDEGRPEAEKVAWWLKGLGRGG